MSHRAVKRHHTGAPCKTDNAVPALVLWNRGFAATAQAARPQHLLTASLLAHREVARAWLVLDGLPGSPEPSAARRWAGIAGRCLLCAGLP